MAITCAIKFYKLFKKSSELIKQLEAAGNLLERQEILENENLYFSDHELDEAYRNLMTNSVYKESSYQLKEWYFWWKMLNKN
jgi:hypothetical protein